MNRIVEWVILLVLLAVILFFIAIYLVKKGFGGFDPVISGLNTEAAKTSTQGISNLFK